jgi:hypothetical protein
MTGKTGVQIDVQVCLLPSLMMPPRNGPPAICPCGHDRDHPDVQPDRHYGFWAWVLLLNGASATPKRVDFVCQRCKRRRNLERSCYYAALPTLTQHFRLS